MTQIVLIQKRIRSEANPEQACHAQRFFKTGPGEYGEGDVFLGIRVPVLRKISREFKALPLQDTRELLTSKYHEERLVALMILVSQYSRADATGKQRIMDTYLTHTRFINNWDLVDASAHKIVGPHLEHRDRRILYTLAKSESLWERRIAIMSTFHFIYQLDFTDTFAVADILLSDTHDLIHKAVGWMLREIGNRNLSMEAEFLKSRYKQMPRTMLRYAIEKFPEPLRQDYLKGRI